MKTQLHLNTENVNNHFVYYILIYVCVSGVHIENDIENLHQSVSTLFETESHSEAGTH